LALTPALELAERRCMTTDLPTRAQLLDMIGSAVLAPSVHNSQPWLFRPVADGVEVYADWRRRLLVSDRDGRALRVSCGAAVYNLRLAMQHHGFTPAITLGTPPGPLVVVQAAGQSQPTPSDSALYDAIPKRHSNRYPFLDTVVSPSERTALVRAAEQEGAWLSLVIGQVALEVVAAMVRLADGVLAADPHYRSELAAWSRSDPLSPDGVSRAAGGPAPEPHDLLIARDFGGAARSPAHDFEPDPFVAVLGTFVNSPSADLTAGQALQRVLLTATRIGLHASLTSQPIDVAPVREQLRVGLHRHGAPHMLLRLGRGAAWPGTHRRPVSDVVLSDDEQPPVASP
jgi:nitroreductase